MYITFIQVSNILSHHLKKEVITLGRIGGQYAKPRSHNFEIINNIKYDFLIIYDIKNKKIIN